MVGTSLKGSMVVYF